MSQSDLLKNWKNRTKATTPPAFPRRPEGEPARASNGQARLYQLQQLYPDNPFYQYAHRYELTGPVDEFLLGQGFTWVVDRHELLRSNFRAVDDDLLLEPGQPGDFDLERAYLDDLPKADQPAEANRLEAEFVQRNFDLEEDYLLRALLIRLSPTEHRLLLSIHHIIGDRGALQLLEEELFGHYTKLIAGQPDDRTDLAVQWSDFAYREAIREVPESHYDYWCKQLAGELPLSALPYDFERPAAASFRGGLIPATVDTEVSRAVHALARRHNTTPNAVFLAAFNAFLYRYTGQEDVLVGSPVSIRDHREIERLIGFLNETVVLRNQVTGEDSFDDLVSATRDTLEAALENKDVPFEWLLRELQPERRGGVNPFFQSMLVYNAAAGERTLPDGLSLRDEPVDLQTAKFDLTLFVTAYDNDFDLTFEYATDLFRQETVERMAIHFGVLLKALVETPAESIGTRPLLQPAEEDLLLRTWNDSFLEATANPQELSPVVSTVVTTTKETPNATAIVAGNDSLTYGELLGLATALAWQLRDAGLEPGTAVGLYCDRTVDLLVGIVGIQLGGGAYVPLDPEYPDERIEYILTDSGASIVIHREGLTPSLPEGKQRLTITKKPGDRSPEGLPAADLQQNAYLIYTSGSTGKPKGIAITHHQLAASTAARFKFYERKTEAFLLLSSFAFDSSVAGLFWTLASHGKLVLSGHRAEQDPAALGRIIRRQSVTDTLLLPSLYQMILEFATPTDLAPLRLVMVAGEACPPSLVNVHFDTLPTTRLTNEYGPTEGTVWSTAHDISPADARGKVPIGRPVYGMGHYVLDANLQPLPQGVVGELYLSGHQLAAGYHGRPDLTAERFLPNPFVEDQRLYRTGDLVRYRRDGLIDFLGRRDEQVKIRGHRIELKEISNALDRLPAVRESVVVALPKEGELQLVAYFTGEGQPDELTTALRQQLPQYMVPAILVPLAELPRLPNGKINRKVLPDPDWSVPGSEGKFVAPAGAMEEQLAGLWQKVLKLDRVGRHDNFFEVGGDSLRSIRVIAGAAKLGIKIAPHQLFNHQTIAELAPALAPSSQTPPLGADATGGGGGSTRDRASSELAERTKKEAPPTPNYEAAVLLRKGGNRPPLFCLHSGGGHVFFYKPLADALNGTRSVYAIQPKGLSGETDLPTSMQEMATNYIEAIKSVQPTGPYLLLGSCFSNALAVEMATQLTASGDEVLPLVIVDSGTGTFMRPANDPDTGNKVLNLLKMVKDGRWDLVARRLRVRSILGYRQVASQLDEQRRNLYGTIGALNEIYAAYEWPLYPGKVLLIRSTEFTGRRNKDHHVTRWQALAGAVDIHVVDGEHLTMFEGDSARGLAATIDAQTP